MQMTKGFFREQKKYSLEEIARNLEETKENTQKLLWTLQDWGIVRCVSKGSQAWNADMEFEFPQTEAEDLWEYKFVFVGLVAVEGHVLKCCPKYMEIDARIMEKMGRVFRVIRKYQKRKEQSLKLEDGGDENGFNKIAVSLYFLEDYFESGFYINEREQISLNGDGEILWEKTIDGQDAFIWQGKPYYLEFYTKETQGDQEEYFRRLHETILFLCTKELEETGLLQFLGIPKPEFQEGDFQDFGGEPLILHRLKHEMLVQFVTRKQRLLWTMYSYILERNIRKKTEDVKLFGTDRFEYVWEDVCGTVFGNVLKEKLKNLPGKLCTKYQPLKEKTLQELIGNPIWEDRIHGIFAAADTLRPDAVVVYEEEGKWGFAILDAKYYQIRFKMGKGKQGYVEGQPGVGDVSKQYLYLMAFKDFIQTQGYEHVKNVFLCPSEDEKTVRAGSVRMDMLEQAVGLGDGRIDVIHLPAGSMYERYLAGKRIKNPGTYLV